MTAGSPADEHISDQISYIPSCTPHAPLLTGGALARLAGAHIHMRTLAPCRLCSLGSRPADLEALATCGASDLVASCPICVTTLNQARRQASTAAHNEGRLQPAPARHLLGLLAAMPAFGARLDMAQSPLRGRRVACFYGCHAVRPAGRYDVQPCGEQLERLAETLGGEPAPFALKTACCGGLLHGDDLLPLKQVNEILACAADSEAAAIVAACPVCVRSLAGRQGAVNRRYGAQFGLPVYFFADLLAQTLP